MLESHSRLEERLGRYRRAVFSVDTRSLALFRIALGLLVMALVADYAVDVRTFYSDEGVLPREAMFAFWGKGLLWSLHALSGATWWSGFLLAVTFVCALGFALGVGWRACGVALWILMVSLANRNPLVMNSGDSLLLLILFWSLFLPLGRHFVPGRRAMGPPGVVSGASAMAIVLQFFFLYFFTALHKSGEQWHYEYSAVWHSLSLREFAQPIGLWLVQFPDICAALTFLTWWSELLVPLGLLIPWRNDLWRYLAVAFTLALHGGLLATLYLGFFPLISICLALPLIPGSFWSWLARWRRTPTAPPARCDMKMPKWSEGLCAAALVFALFSNFESLPKGVFGRFSLVREHFRFTAPDSLAFRLSDLAAGAFWQTGNALRLHQSWRMFSPRPTLANHRVLFEADLDDGRKVEIATDLRKKFKERVADEQSAPSMTWFPNAHWRKYLANLFWDGRAGPRPWLGRYLALGWNRQHGEGEQICRVRALIFTRKVVFRGPMGDETLMVVDLYPPPDAPENGG